jgi:WD40 repeat protein
LSPDQRTALSSSADGHRVLHWDLDTGRCLATLRASGLPGWIGKLCFGADGRRCYAAVGSGLEDDGVVGWELTDGSLVTRYQTQHSSTMALCASTDGRWLVSLGREREMALHDVGEERTVQVFLKDHLNAGRLLRAEIFIGDADLTPDGGRVVTANSDGRVRVWQVEDARLLHTVDGQENPDGTARAMTSVSVCPDGRFAVAGGADGLVRVLDLHTGRWLRTLSGHVGPVTSVHVGDQSRYAVSTGWDGTLRRWELDWELDPDGAA